MFSVGRLVAALIIGFLLAYSSAYAKRALLKSVKSQETATIYETDKGLNLTIKRDQFIGQHITTRVIEKKKNGGPSGPGGPGGRPGGPGGGPRGGGPRRR